MNPKLREKILKYLNKQPDNDIEYEWVLDCFCPICEAPDMEISSIHSLNNKKFIKSIPLIEKLIVNNKTLFSKPKFTTKEMFVAFENLCDSIIKQEIEPEELCGFGRIKNILGIRRIKLENEGIRRNNDRRITL